MPAAKKPTADPETRRREQLRKRLSVLAERMSQSDLARRTDTTRNNVSRYLRGTRIPLDFGQALVEGLGVNPVWLLTGEGAPAAADAAEDGSGAADDLLKLVQSMSAVAKMKLGSLAGKHHMSVLRQLNDALGDFDRLRENLNRNTTPVFREFLDRYVAALDQGDAALADDIRRTLEQLQRLCHDEELTIGYRRAREKHEYYFGDQDKALEFSRENFRHAFLRARKVTPELVSDAYNFVLKLRGVALQAEAAGVCRSILALEPERPEDRAVFEVTLGVCEANLGDLSSALLRAHTYFPALSDNDRQYMIPSYLGLLLHAGAIDFDGACRMYPGAGNQYRIAALVSCALQIEDAGALRVLRERFIGPKGVIPADSFLGAWTFCLLDALEGRKRPGRRFLDGALKEEMEREAKRPYAIRAAAAAAQIARLIGDRKRAEKELAGAIAKFDAFPPECSPNLSFRAIHCRNVLEIVPPGTKNRALRAEREKVREFVLDYAGRGYRFLDGLAARLRPPS